MDFESLKNTTHADVYKGGNIAGHLKRLDNGLVEFRYADGYFGPDIATTLPQTEITEPIASAGGSLPPFFSGLLPEGHRLTLLSRATKSSFDDELTLLLAIGEDTPGDVQIVPAGRTPKNITPELDLDSGTTDFQMITESVDRTGIPGVQDKASASMINTPVSTQGHAAILKIDPPDHPHLVKNEALHLSHARSLGIPISDFSIVQDSAGIPGLLVSRFDRTKDGSRLAMEDAGQVLGIYPGRKYAVDTEEVIMGLAQRTRAPMIAKRNLYLQFLFAWLTGNGDLHAKNVAILQDPSAHWGVSPVYDIPCTAIYRDFSLALPIAGRTKRVRKKHWDECADSIGLPQSAARSVMSLALSIATKIDLADLPFSGSPLHGAQRELRFRRNELLD